MGSGAKKLVGLAALFVALFQASAQDYPHEKTNYPFINYDKNKLEFYGDSSGFGKLFEKFDRTIFEGEGQIDIIHMGGSHIQAGIFSATMRKKIQTIQPGLNSYRGFLFPYQMARTNNPSNYHVRYSGSWSGCRNVEKKKTCDLGLSGISVTTRSTSSSLKIYFDQEHLSYNFTTLKVFHETDSASFSIQPEDTAYIMEVNEELGYTAFHFSNPQDTMSLRFEKTSEEQNYFSLYGLEFENEDPGFAYHAIGVNGADVPAYLRCNLLENHATAVKPDIAIFSIGINDAYTTRFNPEFFKSNYRELIRRIKNASPNVKIIFTTNNDSYYRRRYVNKNGEKVRAAMIELAREHNAAVWDLYTIMGGSNSIVEWVGFGLAKQDKVHFTKAGYELVGDLFFSALIKSYEYHLDKTNHY